MTIQTHHYPELHDAELVSVEYEKEYQRLSIGLVRPDGSADSLTLCGVISIRVSDFISQNVISRVLYSGSMNFDKPLLERLVVWVNSLSDGSCLVSKEVVDVYVSNIQAGLMSIFAIEPSWGAELVCIYTEKVNFED